MVLLLMQAFRASGFGGGGGFNYCSNFPGKIHLYSNQVDINFVSLYMPEISLNYMAVP